MDTSRPTISKVDFSNVRNLGGDIHVDVAGCFYCTQGNVRLRLNGRIFEVKTGDIFIYIPFSHVYIDEYSEDVKGVLCTASTDFVISAVRRVFDSGSLLSIYENPLVSPSDDCRRRLEEMMRVFHARKEQEGCLSSFVVSSLAYALCYEFLGIYIESNTVEPKPRSRQDEVLMRFRRDLFANCRKNRDVCFYAHSQNLTPRYFSNIICSLTGRPALRWIVDAVIDEAKNMLLSESHLSFKEIAYALNFSSQSTFARYFRQYTGMSPGEYRSTHSPK